MDKYRLRELQKLCDTTEGVDDLCKYIESRIRIGANLTIKQFLMTLTEDLVRERTRWVELTKRCNMEIVEAPLTDSSYKALDDYLLELNEHYKELLKDISEC